MGGGATWALQFVVQVVVVGVGVGVGVWRWQVEAHVMEVTEGPYWVEKAWLERSNIAANSTKGLPLNLTFQLVDALTLGPVPYAQVDIWHCDWDGIYSDVPQQHTQGTSWLRGFQLANESGHLIFHTIYPGFYFDRTVHIHMRTRLWGADGTAIYDKTTQIYFEDSLTNDIYTHVYPYNLRPPHMRLCTNKNDWLFEPSNVVHLSGTYQANYGYHTTTPFVLALPLRYTPIILPKNRRHVEFPSPHPYRPHEIHCPGSTVWFCLAQDREKESQK